MSRRAACLMVQGTSSGAGKSLLVTALCRIFARAGYHVAPFKSQNMALNAAVTADGGEIGRAQAAQARAAGVEPTVDMNPILLKPEADHRSQVVVRGRAVASVDWHAYDRMKPELLPVVEESLERLRAAHDVVLIEGAGSPVEINLRAGEIVNMRIAALADAPVLLVGDIDRGGVFAAFVGTMELLEPEERPRVAGFVVNKFRGDLSLLVPGLAALTRRTGIPVLGVVPYIAERLVPAEDSLDLDELTSDHTQDEEAIEIAVMRLPRISNFDDFEPLAAERRVRLRLVRRPAELDGADLIVLPGSKSTIGDLAWLERTGLGDAIRQAAAAGRPVLGICGGYQMLGVALEDPHHVESSVTNAAGLGLLPVRTTFVRDKRAVAVRARVHRARGLLADVGDAELVAYEIHAGHTELRDPSAERPFTIVERGGARAADLDGTYGAGGTVIGTYLHGLFVNRDVRRAVLGALATRAGKPVEPTWGEQTDSGERYDVLADVVAAALDLQAVGRLIGLDIAGQRMASTSGRRDTGRP